MEDNNNETSTRCGFVAIVGRPNVGKSTLLNQILKQKVSITSKKPQTTRHQILGVKTIGDNQIVYVDTPGMHLKQPKVINKYMNKAAKSALTDVDCVIYIVQALVFKKDDQMVLDAIKNLSCPIYLVVNKVDQVKDKESILPFLQEISKKHNFTEIFPTSATRGTNLDKLEEFVAKTLPYNPHFFEEHQVTDKSNAFRIAEIIREKLTRYLGEELPYSLAVEIESMKEVNNIKQIHAIIWVERDGQKKIVIGKEGEILKNIGIKSRMDIENMLGERIMLKLWVKVKSGWSDDDRALKSLGINDF